MTISPLIFKFLAYYLLLTNNAKVFIDDSELNVSFPLQNDQSGQFCFFPIGEHTTTNEIEKLTQEDSTAGK